MSPLEFEITRVDCTCVYELSEEFLRDSKNEFELAKVNEPSVIQGKRAIVVRAIELRL